MIENLRAALALMPSDHDASGDYRPSVNEVFCPDQHANALDPHTPVVVGARGTGKSFWAGVLEQDETRKFAAAIYPRLGLERLLVRAGYTGFSANGAVTAQTIDARVPAGREGDLGYQFWTTVVLRAARSAVDPSLEGETVKSLMDDFSDPEELEAELARLDKVIMTQGKVLLVTFDAIDTWSTDWRRSAALTNVLFRVVWSFRALRGIRAKVFIRPEQLYDESLTFVEMPKLRSGRVQLEWSIVDLYGLLYWRLAELKGKALREFKNILPKAVSDIERDRIKRRKSWRALFDKKTQESVMISMSGNYMGRSHKKGKTYEWPYKHLSDAKGEVTPRSFIKLFVEAAKVPGQGGTQLISSEAMRHGLREASKVRVDQLGIEYKWVKRALAPLAGVRVPCEVETIHERWTASETVNVIMKAAKDPVAGFLPPFLERPSAIPNEQLEEAMSKIGVFAHRSDGRIDIPDLFRVAARMLKKGGVTPTT